MLILSYLRFKFKENGGLAEWSKASVSKTDVLAIVPQVRILHPPPINNMAEVKILIQGYTSADSIEQGEELTCPTITLVRDKDIVMVVDPGVLESQDVLVEALKKVDLSVEEVNYVFLTHSHLDHYRNIGMFKTAKTVEYFGVWDKRTVDDWQEQFSDNIEIIKTPGHNYDALSLLVRTDIGTVAIVGDVFWKEGEPKDDPYASDKKELEKSRKRVLELADYIIPGHGPMFKVKK